jgi:uncharacterized protein (TIGR02266 family)
MSDQPPQQLRLSPRIAATFKVRYQGFDQFLTEYTEDLSRGGMFLATRNFLPLNSIIRCVLYLPGSEAEVRIIGRVRHVMSDAEAKQCGRNPGMGIEFLDLPRDDADRLLGYLARMSATNAHAKPDAPALKLAAGVHLRKRREAEILVVDDQAAYLEEVALALGRAGFRVRSAANGLIGLAQCLQRPPDLILCDVQMPQMDGWALLRIVRARASLAPIPFVFLTSLAGEAQRLEGYKLGVDDYIAKPHDLDALAGRLDRTLARYEDSPRRAIDTKTLSGDLDQVSLRSLLLYLAAESKSGVLLLARHNERATIYLNGGRPIACELDRPGASGEDKLLDALGWPQGRFEFAAQDVPMGDEIKKPLDELLSELDRRTSAHTVANPVD